MKIYMAVTADKYELPIAVFNGIKEMMEWSGRSKTSCSRAIRKQQKDKKFNCRYVKVEKEEEEQ